ncbi:pseudouridine synthase [Luteimonas sp. MC1572]|uniref:pseudouridine synthase n=1 Tax=Luteimonas sp. MC1572 TaxID=2799325 RepID=UPI0018F08FAF|nr:pseudouridine synthase [Luteimonas sp. MC1572]MBJ6980721.1 rRNA pseudouridine synthase [Luteimonas sp. MC1572]QQO02092.1 rRNA pseudouridine synthase [Luteimonas sp. MC1572]
MTEDKKGGRKLSLKRGTDANGVPEAATPRMEERLHKVLAQAGLGSRRALEQRIADGLVKVNGEVAQTGMSIRGGDRVELDGRSFVASALTEPARVLIYNKPEGEVTTREDPEGRPTIFDSLPTLKGARWIAIGRLDINTTGLLLLTTDGEIANAMMHPSFEVAREYVCRVRAPEGEESVDEKIIDRLRRGVALEDGPAKFDEIKRIGGTDSNEWFQVLLKEGRNREVRRLWESQGCQVSRLKRIRYGAVELPQPLLRGQSQELAADKVEALRRELKLDDGAPAALTLLPVIGQRRASKSTVHVGDRPRSAGYVGGHSTADEGRELRRFDNVREDRGRRGQHRPSGGLTVTGEAAARQSHNPLKQRRDQRALPEGNPAAFRSWYVPDGVETGPSGHRNAGPGAPKPYGARKAGPGGGQGRPGGGQGRPGGAGGGPGGGKPQRAARPYGHPGNAPSFPSDHAGGYAAQERPRGARPAGARPGGGRPGASAGPGRPGGRPGGNPGAGKPGGNRPGGSRPAGGNRGPRGPGGGGGGGGRRGA